MIDPRLAQLSDIAAGLYAAVDADASYNVSVSGASITISRRGATDAELLAFV